MLCRVASLNSSISALLLSVVVGTQPSPGRLGVSHCNGSHARCDRSEVTAERCSNRLKIFEIFICCELLRGFSMVLAWEICNSSSFPAMASARH